MKVFAVILFVVALFLALVSLSGNALQSIGPAILALAAVVAAGFAWSQPRSR